MVLSTMSSTPSKYSVLVTLGSTTGHAFNLQTKQRQVLKFGVSPSAVPTPSQRSELNQFIGNRTALYVNAVGYAIDGGKKTGNERGPVYLQVTDETLDQFANTSFVGLLPKDGNHIIFNRNYKLLGGKEFSGQWAIQAQWLINKLALGRDRRHVALTCVFLCLIMWYSTYIVSTVCVAAITSLFFPRAPSVVIDCGGKSMTAYSVSLPYWLFGRIFGFVPSNARYRKDNDLTMRLQEFNVNPNDLYKADPTGQSFADEANRAIDSLNLDPDEVIVYQTGKMRQDGVKKFLHSGYLLYLLSQDNEIKLELLDLVENVFGRPVTGFILEVDGDTVSVIGN